MENSNSTSCEATPAATSQPVAEGPLDPVTLKGSYLGALIMGGAIIAMLLGGDIMSLQENTRKNISAQEKQAARRKLMLTVENRVLADAVRAQPSMASRTAPLPSPKF